GEHAPLAAAGQVTRRGVAAVYGEDRPGGRGVPGRQRAAGEAQQLAAGRPAEPGDLLPRRRGVEAGLPGPRGIPDVDPVALPWIDHGKAFAVGRQGGGRQRCRSGKLAGALRLRIAERVDDPRPEDLRFTEAFAAGQVVTFADQLVPYDWLLVRNVA